MFHKILYMCLCALITMPALANSQHQHHNHHDHSNHAPSPIGIMGGHIHKPGEWMTSYRFQNMQMKGNRKGSTRQTISQVHNDFMVAPTDMRMQMHMFGLMYGVNEKLTIMSMLSYNEKTMNHINRMGATFKTSTQGIGDTKLSALYTLYDNAKHKVHVNLGLSLPTGSTDERGTTLVGANQKLPYPMQLGSGTFDPILGITYNHQCKGPYSLGAQANTTLRFGDNDEGYRLGNEYNATAWIARTLTSHISTSFRLNGKIWGDVHGQDTELNPAMVPTARADLRGGQSAEAIIGINLKLPYNNVLSAEYTAPFYQNLDGPQLETDHQLMLGWQKTF